MISVSGKKWIERKINKNSIEKIKQDFKFNDIISKLIISRNFDINEINSIKNSFPIINDFKIKISLMHFILEMLLIIMKISVF